MPGRSGRSQQDAERIQPGRLRRRLPVGHGQVIQKRYREREGNPTQSNRKNPTQAGPPGPQCVPHRQPFTVHCLLLNKDELIQVQC